MEIQWQLLLANNSNLYVWVQIIILVVLIVAGFSISQLFKSNYVKAIALSKNHILIHQHLKFNW